MWEASITDQSLSVQSSLSFECCGLFDGPVVFPEAYLYVQCTEWGSMYVCMCIDV